MQEVESSPPHPDSIPLFLPSRSPTPSPSTLSPHALPHYLPELSLDFSLVETSFSEASPIDTPPPCYLVASSLTIAPANLESIIILLSLY